MIKKLFKLFLLLTIFLNAQNYKQDWNVIKGFEKKNQPKKALDVVDNIYIKAKKDNNETEFIKALLYKEKYTYILQKDFDKRIKDIENQIKSSTKITTKLILKSIVAQMYKDFLDVHRYKRIHKSYIDEDKNKNIYSWSLKKLEDKASSLYLETLNDEAKVVSIDNYRDILSKSENSSGLRPTLYDFLAFRALDYFNSLNRYNQFFIDKKEAFSSINHFIEYDFNRDKSDLPKYKSILIYKKLLNFHKKDKDSRALEYINFKRLQFVYKNFINSNRDEYYLDALKSLESQKADSQALYLARYYIVKDRYDKAIIYAKKGIKSKDRYISSQCKSIKSRIEQKNIGIAVEEINLPNENILAKVSYKNIKKIYLRVIKLNDKEHKKVDSIYGKERDNYIKNLTFINEQNITLPKIKDYKEHSSEISLGSYSLGEYMFVISNDIKFSKNISYTISTISKLAYFHKNSKILVVDRENGNPIKDANVTFKSDGKTVTIKSDKNGLVEIPKNLKSYSFKLKYKSDVLNFRGDNYYKNKKYIKKDKSKDVIYFFTDRTIYSPSGKILFKGLVVKQFNNKKPQIVANRKVKVILNGSSGKKLKTKIFKTDEFGSFYGSFDIPKNAKIGFFYLSSNIFGGKSIDVVKYKKAKFSVKFNKLNKSYRLGDRVAIKGSVKSYSGNRLDGAKIVYRVSKIVNFNWLDEWEDIPIYKKETEVTIGKTTTDKNGNFKIEFDAISDNNIPKDTKPLFSYRVSIDITDSSKEKQSYTRVVNIGYVALNIDMIVSNELDKNQANFIRLDSRDLYGSFEEAEGKIVIEKLKPKKRLYRKRYWKSIDTPLYTKEEFEKLFKNYEYKSSIYSREKEKIKTIKFNTKKSKEILLEHLEQGEYIFTLFTEDKYGTKVKKSKKITVYDINKNTPPYKMALWQRKDKKEYAVGSTATINMKSSMQNSMVFFNLYQGDKVVKEKWITIKGLTKELINISKKDSGDIFYSILMIKNGRDYSQKGIIEVPWKNRLKVEYISFQDRLKPNSKTSWKIKISGMNKDDNQAQMVATLYDASIDNSIKNSFNIDNLYPKNRLSYYNKWNAKHFYYRENKDIWKEKIKYIKRDFYKLNWFGFNMNKLSLNSKVYNEPSILPPQSYTPEGDNITKQLYKDKFDSNKKDFADTIFFKPILKTDKDGNIILDFKMNNTLSHWTFLGFIHTKDLKTAITKKEIVTKKEIMVTSNLPKFFREGDTISLSQTVSNLSSEDLNGSFELKLLNPINNREIFDKNLTKSFKIKKGSFVNIKFKIKIPKSSSVPAIKYIAIAKTKEYKDIEQSTIPILTNRALITKSKALYIKEKRSSSFTLEALKDANLTKVKSHKLIIEFTSNPAWYAIVSMPYVMKYPHQSIENVFNRYFVDAIAYKLLTVSPKVEKIFKEWKEYKDINNTSILITDSQKEQQKNIANLLDIKRLLSQKKKEYVTLKKRELQHYDGGWSWFEGGKSNWYITQYIVEWFGKLKEFGINKTDSEMMGLATAFIDKQVASQYKKLKESVKKGETKLEYDHLNSITIHYLYARSFYKFPILSKEAYKYYLSQAKKYWSKKGLYEQAIIALTLNKKLGKNEAMEIVNSIKQKAIIDNNLGMYFKYSKKTGLNELPIEKHTMLMELFKEVAKDKKSVELMKIWLLKNRKNNHWKTTKSTASAIYALLSDDAWILNKNRLVDIEFNTTIDYKPIIKKAKKEATKGIGYFKASFNNFDKNMSTIKVTNPNSSVVWGGLYWQYFEDLDNRKDLKKLPITINKKIIPMKNSNIKIGDKVKVKIEINVKEDMDFIVLKDELASAFIPVNITSKHINKNGLEYYKSVKDSAIYFFFEKLPKGVYSFEYPIFITHSGKFNSGTTTIKSLYSPKFINYIKGKIILIE